MPTEPQQRAFAVLDEWVPDPKGGLPEELFLFISRFTPVINVDLFVHDERHRTLLTWRQDEIYGAGWHIPGGIIRYRETAEHRIHATALAELGADVAFDPEPFAVEQAMDHLRRERGHFISLLYRCRLLAPPDPAREFIEGTPQREQWAWHESCPPNLIPWQNAYRKFF